jgi:hypothetical protein
MLDAIGSRARKAALLSLLFALVACSSNSAPVDGGLADAAVDQAVVLDASDALVADASRDAGADLDAALDQATADAAAPTTVRVLFIGNSYTYVNDLPGVLKKLADAAQSPIRIVTGQHTPGGATWEQHAQSAQAEQLITQGWDYVVLQDQSQQPWVNLRVKAALATLDGKIKAAGGKTALFMTWARSAQVAGSADQLFRMRMAVNRYYEANAESVGATVVPVGRAWERAYRTTTLTLHSGDGSHPAPLGTYLAACSFYAALAQKSPSGLGDGGLTISAQDRAALQKIAWETHQARQAPASPLVGRWPLGAADELSDLVPSAGVKLGAATGPKPTIAATQFGSGAYLAIPYRPRLRPKSALTVALLVHRGDWSAPLVSNEQGIVGKWNGFEIRQVGGKLEARVSTVTTALPSPLSVDVTTLAPGWHHVALTYDGAKQALWVDGVEAASGSVSGDLRYYGGTVPVDSAVYAGIAVGGVAFAGLPSIELSGMRFSGRLADLQLYDRALSTAELTALLP